MKRAGTSAAWLASPDAGAGAVALAGVRKPGRQARAEEDRTTDLGDEAPDQGQTSVLGDDRPGMGDRPPHAAAGARVIDSPRKLRNRDLTALRNVNDPPPIRQYKGWPKGVARTFTPEVIEGLVKDILQYADDNEFPTEAEFCYTRGINFQRLNDIPALREAKEMMLAKRQAMIIRRGLTLTQGEGPLGAFLSRMLSHAGQYSMLEKQELTHAGSIGVQIVDDI